MRTSVLTLDNYQVDCLRVGVRVSHADRDERVLMVYVPELDNFPEDGDGRPVLALSRADLASIRSSERLVRESTDGTVTWTVWMAPSEC